MMKITIVGTGYVGLVAAVCFAKLRHVVTAVDREAVIESMLSGKLPIWEPGVEELFVESRSSGRLLLESDLAKASIGADMLMIAVGTPPRSDGSADLSQIRVVANELTRKQCCPPLLVVKSTVPVGTCDELDAALKLAGVETEVVFNPEFLRQGSAVRDFLEPDRIVIGMNATDEISFFAEKRMRELYLGVDSPIQVSDRRSAEMIKYAANAFLAMKISFANMMADLCEAYHADIEQVMTGVGLDHRIGSSFLRAGIGYGGSCFPKDVQALLAAGRAARCPLPLLNATVAINDARVPRLFQKLVSILGNPAGNRVCILGLSFKPMTGDLREAPSLSFIAHCLEAGMNVHVYDPVVRILPIPGVQIFDNPYEASMQTDAIIIVTEWSEFAELDWGTLTSNMNRPVVLDGRNSLHKDVVKDIIQNHDGIYIPVGQSIQGLHESPREQRDFVL